MLPSIKGQRVPNASYIRNAPFKQPCTCKKQDGAYYNGVLKMEENGKCVGGKCV